MKKLLILSVLGSFSIVSAGQYAQYQPGGSYNSNPTPQASSPQGYYQSNGNQFYQEPRPTYQYENQQPYQPSYQNHGQPGQQPIQNQPTNTPSYYQQSGPSPTHGNSATTIPGQLAANSPQNKPIETPVESSDRDISKNIHEVLYGWISSGKQNIAFELTEGKVTLTGYVDSQEDKDKIEEGVKKIQGVKEINNKIIVSDPKKFAYYQPKTADNARAIKHNGRIVKDYAALENDKKINAAIRSKLDAQGYADVAIITANGVVTLAGTVDNGKDLEKFVIEIEKVDGVKKVKSKVVVKK